MNVPGAAGALQGVLARYRRQERPRRKPGRPLKRTPEYLVGVLAAHERVLAWFAERHGQRPVSERELYTLYFAEQFVSRGERAGRASTQEFQAALKTLRNELAEARRLERTRPENYAVSGTPPPVK